MDASGVAPCWLVDAGRATVRLSAKMEELLRGTDKFERTQQRVNEFEKAMIASDAKRARKMETEEVTGDPTDRTGSLEEIVGNPHDNAASSSTATTSPSEMDTTDRPEFKRARVGDDVEMCAVDEEDGLVDCEVFDTKTGDILAAAAEAKKQDTWITSACSRTRSA